MIRRYFLIGAALVAIPALAVAEDAKPLKAKKPPKVCRTDETSGSRIVRQICKTQAQWDEEARLNDVSNGDFETRGNRVATGRNINTGSTSVGGPQ